MTGLLELAARCEAAIAEQQAPLLIEAFDLTNWRSRAKGRLVEHNPQWWRFDKMIRAEAFESAAMTLVPEGHDTQVHLFFGRDGEGSAIVTPLKRIGLPRIFAATPALALTAAALRSRAALVDKVSEI